jgi:hypothetical protein
VVSAADGDSASQVRFNRDVRPILSDRCFLCHGPDQSSEQAKESDLRLDDRESAIEYDIFDFSAADDSVLMERITSNDPDLQMPPPGSQKKKLSPTEIETVKKWIQQGAKYEKHCSGS